MIPAHAPANAPANDAAHDAAGTYLGFYRLDEAARFAMGDNNGMPLGRGNGNARAVLVVEDSENSAATLEIALLGIPGISVLLTASAVEAMRILNSGEPHIQVIVTDLNMPVMDGFELIRRVRADVKLANLPIVVVSGDTDPATPSRIAALGVNAFFPKPFSPAQVRRKLEQLLDGSSQ